ncbi:MAG: shikimate dehydrogenase [Rikenellaceae bacterium]
MYGILGYPLGHSFSKMWFTERGYEFQNFECQSVEDFLRVLPQSLEGFSVTIPHKEAIMPYLDAIDSVAEQVGAVNCVKVCSDGSLKGFNTDVVGFDRTISPSIISDIHRRAAVLGSGGAAKAVVWVLENKGIKVDVISRKTGGYTSFRAAEYDIIVNCTPLGMYPNVESAPSIDYCNIREHTICYDLVYNPEVTKFLALCAHYGATAIGGLQMLHYQAEAALLHYAE